MVEGALVKIDSATVPAGGQASIVFTNISQSYDDLVIKLHGRSTRNDWRDGVNILLNGSSASFSCRAIEVTGTANAGSFTTSTGFVGNIPGATSTASTYGVCDIYIPNYRSSANKSITAEAVQPNASTSAITVGMYSVLWSNNSAITSITLDVDVANFAEGSTAVLYGVTRIPRGAKATGGVIYDDATHWYHVFTSSGTFTPSQSLSCDVLVIAGGGGGGDGGGGGGAGGLLYFSNQTVSISQTVTVGAGGAAATQGGSSIFGSLTTAVGGGRGGDANTNNAGSGGSGGGAGRSSVAGTLTGGAATSGQGNAGGTTTQGFTNHPSSGGGGAGAAGGNGNTNNQSGAGGNGVSTYSSIGLATNTGQNISGTVWYAGGGGGNGDAGSLQRGLGGNGGGGAGGGAAGGGAQAGTPGTANTGGGGGGSHATTGSTGGSGIVIVRYSK